MKVVFEPWKRLEIRSHTVYENVERLLDAVSAPVPPNTPAQTGLLWANGVAFRHQSLANSDSLAKAHLEGVIIWDTIEVAPMPKYERELHPPSKPMVTVQFLDVSASTTFAPVTKWVKQKLLS